MAIQRNIAPYIQYLLKSFPIVAIVGARQVGKTTLAKRVGEEFLYMDLEVPSHYERVSQDPEFFFKQHSKHVIFDEAQLLPALFPVLRAVVDDNREEKGRFIITGSSSPELFSNISESLAGRVTILELGTLKANEYCHTPLNPFYEIFNKRLDKSDVPLSLPTIDREKMQHFWLKGGYPEPIMQDDPFWREWMADYQSTYINRDIARLFPRLNKVNYQRFITMLGKLSGTIINKSDLARALNVSQPTITEYLDIVHGTFIWRQLQAYESNAMKGTTKMPKGHIRDSGFLHSLLHIQDLENLQSDPMVGRSFEGFVIEEILKGLQDARVRDYKAYYYRTRSGAEIDLILEGAFGLLPIEIKYGYRVERAQLRSLNDFIEKNKLPFGVFINQGDEVRWLTEKIVQIPAGCI